MPEINKIRPIENFAVVQNIKGSSKDKQVKKRKQQQDQRSQKQQKDTNQSTEETLNDDLTDSSKIDYCA
ncbi:MAG: hypothetical protein KAS23_08330 [Anaerohalosphaera sp.]|nr:hypothetical protein [Anaerohalosphaera sp.]